MVVEPDEVAECDGEIDVVGYRERVEADLVLKSGHQDGEAQRVESGLEEHQVIVQRLQSLALLGRDRLDRRDDGGSHIHRMFTSGLRLDANEGASQ